MDEVDALTNVFSEEGRIHQVEYAIKSVSSAGASLGIAFSNGVVLLGKNTDSTLTLIQDEKIYRINERIHAIVGGLYADSNVLINYLRIQAQEHLQLFDQDMSLWHTTKTLSRIKQEFTQQGGMRPFGVSFILAGYNDMGEYSMYSTDPSGTPIEWKTFAFGEGDKSILPVLEERQDNCTMEDALLLGFRALAATSEGSVSSPNAIVCTVLYKDESSNHHARRLPQEEITKYLEQVKRREAEQRRQE
ncbi:20S proteasome subunit alpha 3 [Nematocida sp. LUAm3]|nr:20S proteasome subunit alpha 3 [Nematocida sp. LUAm3]KAI5173698.1 20S proteasome subunit alpha 3 [Nematocida sp. LUAm2]KAI5176920.1 20S proteasome subunit alpha 3 [Nematocida sp. LUAm1]